MSGSIGLILIGIGLVAAASWAALGGMGREGAFKQVARDLGARYTSGGLFGSGKVEAHIQKWTLTLEVTSSSDGKHTYTFTRMHAPFENRDAFELSLYQQGAAGRVQMAVVSQDIHIGVPDFDAAFTIWSNNPTKVRTLLADAGIRQLIQQQPGIKLTVKGPGLHFETKGAIADVPRLKSLFDLFKELLPALER